MQHVTLRFSGALGVAAAAIAAIVPTASATPPTPGDAHDVVLCRAPNIEVSVGKRNLPPGGVVVKVWQDLGPLYTGVVMPTTVAVDWRNLRTGARGHLEGAANNLVELTAMTGTGPVSITSSAESRTTTPGPVGVPVTPHGRCEGRFTVT
ncbi:hypothetical protein AXK56_00465 [Tsukamurella pulmonis]|uniref:Uncharacterized protein n=1 Tax=Tsukamurella pulmonis TaxID=47312 RepID=A0A1H1ANC9_9ACTN|nr:hypothetical protein [Tsukamurella pulmonis]KXO96059.1 hypothetical protein AXK56_00465 [Tsukamurella pulmonis]SDQ41124.1 hypothetical protein SAMN04489765_0307 [Tsukamurella pulmonis]SUP26365.1 Uncharacterised protein [Tsukamurella pulmonis]